MRHRKKQNKAKAPDNNKQPEKSLENISNFENWVTEGAEELTDAERVELHLEITRFKEDKNKNNKMIKALQNELIETQRRLEVVLETCQPVKPPVIDIRPRWEKREAVPVFIASDWHVEERVDKDQVNDLNEYNLAIAEKRINHYFESCLWILDRERSSAVVEKGVFALLGDLITGYIHEELRESNWLSPTEAINWLHAHLQAGIKTLLEKGKFKELLIPCCFGNHGRVHPDKVISTAAQNSYEWLMYQYLARDFKNDPRVRFYIANGYHNFVDVFDTKIRFHHGDHVRFGGGVGGITIPLNKKIAKWNTTITADIDVMGHFHQYFNGGNFVVNGSLIGWNAYAISIGASYEMPQQAYFIVRPGRGMTDTGRIFVTSRNEDPRI